MQPISSWLGRGDNPARVDGVVAFSLGRRGLTAGVVKRAALLLSVLALACSSKSPSDDDDRRPRGGSAGIGGGAGMANMAGLAGAGGSAAGAPGGAGGAAGSSMAGASGAAGGSVCAFGQVSCNGVCATTATDPMNCGFCSNPCPSGSQCVAGSCQVTCGTGQALCAGACQTIVSDPANCGACGTVCPAGQVCAAGACAADCGVLQECVAAGGTQCADVMTNPSHCGTCGTACAPGQSCVAGACVSSCSAGQVPCAGQCVDSMTNAAHCGGCGVACPAGTPCIAGFCGCPTGQSLCNGVCVDTTSSAGNCGACGAVCPTGQACEAGTCRTGCSAGLMLCGGSCVNTADSEAHCGACDVACASAQSCMAGSCQCPNGGMLCAAACVNTQTDLANCGACGTACFTGQTCTAGVRTCPATLTACNSACVNTMTSSDHCGACGQTCGSGSTCVAGVCTCPMGQTLCAGLCVDTQVSGEHCGACAMACATGQMCIAGTCSGAGGVGADGCTGGLARNIAVSRIDAFQTVAVGIMEDGDEIATTARNTDLVAGRETLFRIFVTPGSGWTTRELSARVTLVNGATSDEYFAKKSVSGASNEDDSGSTFQVAVPLDKITATSQYRVELVECGTPPSGSATTPLFPLTGEVALGARTTGVLKVAMVPFLCNTRLPDTTEAGLAPYEAILDAMYPVTGVEITVASQISTGYPVDWNDALDSVRSKRQQDGPAADVYYYGLLKCTDTFQQFCGGGCTAGIGYVGSANQAQSRASMGIAFAGGDQSAATMAHEIGHNHGRSHAPCVPQGGSISGVDGNFPYDGANIGVWGWDKRTDELIDPNDGVTDIMGYCNNKWISDYTYDALVARVVAVSGAASIYVNPDVLDRFHVLMLDAVGPRWGRPINELVAPDGTAEVAEMLDADDNVLEYSVVYRSDIPDINAASYMVPAPRRGWAKVRISGTRALAFK